MDHHGEQLGEEVCDRARVLFILASTLILEGIEKGLRKLFLNLKTCTAISMKKMLQVQIKTITFINIKMKPRAIYLSYLSSSQD